MKKSRKDSMAVIKIEKQQQQLQKQQDEIQKIIMQENDKLKTTSSPVIPTSTITTHHNPTFAAFDVQVIEIPSDQVFFTG